MDPITLNIKDFEDTGREIHRGSPKFCYMTAMLQICGVWHHVDLVQVKGRRYVYAVDEKFQRFLDALENITGSRDELKTVTMNRRRYVVIITPFNA